MISSGEHHAPTLDYADQPPGSRLIVQRLPDRLIIVDPPTGLWPQVRDFFFLGLIHVAFFATLITVLLHWLTPMPPTTVAWSLMKAWFSNWQFSAQLLGAVAIYFAMAFFIGRVGRTITIDAERIVVEARHGIPFVPRLPERGFTRSDITDVRSWFFGALILLRVKGRRVQLTPMNRRHETKWLVRLLRRELGLTDPGAPRPATAAKGEPLV